MDWILIIDNSVTNLVSTTDGTTKDVIMSLDVCL